MFSDFIIFSIKYEAVWDPTVVSSEDEDFRVIKGKAAKSISCWPLLIFVNDRYDLPFLIFEGTLTWETIEPFNAI